MRGKKAKLLRKYAKSLAKVPNSLRAIEHSVLKKGPDGKIYTLKRLQAFWTFKCPRRIYKDMKKERYNG